jgi:hypothetical protein
MILSNIHHIKKIEVEVADLRSALLWIMGRASCHGPFLRIMVQYGMSLM